MKVAVEFLVVVFSVRDTDFEDLRLVQVERLKYILLRTVTAYSKIDVHRLILTA